MRMRVVHLAPVGDRPSRCCGKTRAELADEPITFNVEQATCGIYGTALARRVNAEWDRAEAEYYDQI